MNSSAGKEHNGKSAEKRSEAEKETAVFSAKGMTRRKRAPISIEFKEGNLTISKAQAD